jgi:hypothetical protein
MRNEVAHKKRKIRTWLFHVTDVGACNRCQKVVLVVRRKNGRKGRVATDTGLSKTGELTKYLIVDFGFFFFVFCFLFFYVTRDEPEGWETTEDLSLGDEGGGIDQRTVAVEDLNVNTLVDDATLLLELEVLLATKIGQTPLLGHNDVLLSGELELSTTEALNHTGNVLLTATDSHKDLTNVNASGNTGGLTESTTHTGLQTIGTSAGQHLVDAENVEGMDTHAQMEAVLTSRLGEVLVGADTSSLKSFGGDHLALERDHVNGGGERLDGSSLGSDVIDADAWVGDTTAKARLRVRLTRNITVAGGKKGGENVRFSGAKKRRKGGSAGKKIGLLVLQRNGCKSFTKKRYSLREMNGPSSSRTTWLVLQEREREKITCQNEGRTVCAGSKNSEIEKRVCPEFLDRMKAGMLLKLERQDMRDPRFPQIQPSRLK